MPISVSRLIRSRRKTIAVIVERDGSVTVRAPLKMSTNEVEQFVQKHSNWVQKKQLEVKSLVPQQPRKYAAGDSFLYMGQTYPLEFVRDTGKKLILDGSFRLAETEQNNAEVVFRDWYRKQAAKIIPARVTIFTKQFGLQVEKIRITSARTRWGSCSPKGTLSFSWRLLMTPLDVIDYVVVHELAHLIHHNHSKRFWKLVEQWMPDYRERRTQLKKYGPDMI